jgi:hypothetical protein
MSYDTTGDQINNPNTTFVEPKASATTAPAAAPSPSSDFGPPAGAGASSSGGAVTASSEAPPSYKKPNIDPRPYAYFAKNNPQFKAAIDDAAELTGVNPLRLAAHKWAESRGNLQSARGADGEIGIMQIMPSTAREIDPTGKLDPNNPHDALIMAGMYINKLDGKFGQDSFKSIARYNGSGPHAIDYARRLTGLGGKDFDPSHYGYTADSDSAMNTKGLVAAGSRGPDQFLNYAVQTAPPGMPMSDVWRTAEANLVEAFMRKGDIAGAQHARDFVLQLSHAGANQYLMAADKAMQMGDGVSAAQYLAKSHAFFPDDTIGRFRTNGKDIYAERIDEHDPTRRLGPSIQVTPESIRALLNQTTDPQQYLKTVRENQAAAADARLKEAHGAYYGSLPATRIGIAAMNNQRALDVADKNAASRENAANIAAGSRERAATIRAGGSGQKGALTQNQVNKDVEDRYGDLAQPDLAPAERAQMSELHAGLTRGGLTGTSAQAVVKGLGDKSLKLMRGADGSYAAVDKEGKPVALIPKEYGDKFAPPQQSATGGTPVGAGAATPYAVGAGVQQNLAGTQMPQR